MFRALGEDLVSHPYLTHHVTALYSIASAPVDDPPGVGMLAMGILGPRAFDVPSGPMPVGVAAHLIVHEGAWRIRAFEAAPRDSLIESIAVALARWYTQNFAADDRLLLAALAARILLPSAALERHGESLGFDVPRISERFAVPERIVAIRLREFRAPSRSGSMRRIEIAV